MQKVSFPQCRRSGGIITVSAAAQVSSFPGPPSDCVNEHGWTRCAGCPAGGAAGCSDTGRRGRGRWGGRSGRHLGQLIRELDRAAAVEEGARGCSRRCPREQNLADEGRRERPLRPRRPKSHPSLVPEPSHQDEEAGQRAPIGGRGPRRAHAFPPRTSWGDPLGRPGTRGEAGVLKSAPKRVADSCDSAEAPLPAGLTSHV